MRGWWIPAVLVAAACSDNNGSGPGTTPQSPTTLSSVSLDGAIALSWSDNAYVSDPSNFQNYRVYSTTYNIDTNPTTCGSSFTLEGTTVAPEFVVGALTNGVPRCFAVTAISVDGFESDRSPLRGDTPRPDARNVVVFARQSQNAQSGFRFWDDLNGDGQVESDELGLVRDGSSANIDFSVDRDANGDLFLTPVRAGTGVEYYDSAAPVEDLTSIDFAPDQTLPVHPDPSRSWLRLCLPDERGRWDPALRGAPGHPRGPDLPDSRLGLPDGSGQSRADGERKDEVGRRGDGRPLTFAPRPTTFPPMPEPDCVLDGRSLTVAEVVRVARQSGVRVVVDPTAREALLRSRQLVERAVATGQTMYGINTGFGKLANVRIASDQLEQLQINLIRSHAAGVGDPLPAAGGARGDAAARQRSAAPHEWCPTGAGGRPRGDAQCRRRSPGAGAGKRRSERRPRSAQSHRPRAHGGGRDPRRRGTARRREALLADGAPRALSLCAEGRARVHQRHPGANGAAGASGARRTWSCGARPPAAAAMSLEALGARPRRSIPGSTRPVPIAGQIEAADLMRALLADSEIRESHREDDPRVQDAYSLRCAPQVLGAVSDAIRFAEETVAVELNASTDNPLVFENGDVISGGNFHGQPVAQALDLLAMTLTTLQAIAERRVERLVNPDLSQGLPAFLTSDPGPFLRLHDGADHRRVPRRGVSRAGNAGEHRLDSHRRQPGGLRSNGDGRGLEGAAHSPERAAGRWRRAAVCGPGTRVSEAADARKGVAALYRRLRALTPPVLPLDGRPASGSRPGAACRRAVAAGELDPGTPG